MMDYVLGFVPTIANLAHNGFWGVEDLKKELKTFSNESGEKAISAFKSFFEHLDRYVPNEYYTLAETIYYSSILSILKDRPWKFNTDQEMVEHIVETFAKQHLLEVLSSLARKDADIPAIRRQFISEILNAAQTNTWTGQGMLILVRQFQEIEMVTKPVEALMQVVRTLYQSNTNPEIDEAYGKLLKEKIDTFVQGLDSAILKTLYIQYTGVFHGLVDSALGLALDADTLEVGQVQQRVQNLLESLGRNATAASIIEKVLEDKLRAHLDPEAFEFVKGLALRFLTTQLQNTMDAVKRDQTDHVAGLQLKAVTAKAKLQEAFGMDVQPKVDQLFDKIRTLQAARIALPVLNMRDATGQPFVEPLLKNLIVVALYEIMNSCDEPKLQNMLDKFSRLATQHGPALRDVETRGEKVAALRSILNGMLNNPQALHELLPEVVRSRISMDKLLNLASDALVDMLGPTVVAIAEAKCEDARVEALEKAMDGAIEFVPIEAALKALFRDLHGTEMRKKIDAIILSALDEGTLVDAARKLQGIVKNIYAVDIEGYVAVLQEIDEASLVAGENPVLDAIVDQVIQKLGDYSDAARVKADLMKRVLRGALAKLGNNPEEKIFEAVMSSTTAEDAAKKLLPENFALVTPYLTKYLEPYFENANKLHALAEQFRASGKARPLHALFDSTLTNVITREAHNQAILAGVNLTDILDNISFENPAEFTQEEHDTMGAFMQPFVDQKLAENPQLVEDALTLIFGLLVKSNDGATSASSELESFIAFVMPKLTEMYRLKGNEIEAVNAAYNANSAVDFVDAYRHQVDPLSWSRMVHLEGEELARKVKDAVLRGVMKEEIKTLLAEILDEKIQPQVDPELFAFLRSNVLRASGVAVLGNLVVHLAEDMKYHDASLKAKASAGRIAARRYPGLEAHIERFASMDMNLSDPLFAAFASTRRIENPFAGDQFGVAFQKNFAWSLVGLVLKHENPVQVAYVGLENAYNKLRLKDHGVDVDVKLVMKEFIDEVIGFDEFEALLPQVAKDYNVLDSLLSQYAAYFETLVRDIHKANNRSASSDFDRQIAKLLGFPIAHGFVHTAFNGAEFMRNPKVLGALFEKFSHEKYQGDLDIPFLADKLMESLFPHGLPALDAEMNGVARAQARAQLETLFAQFATAEQRKLFIAQILGVKGDIADDVFLDVDSDLIDAVKEKALVELSNIIPGWMNNTFFFVLFWPLIALVTWGVEYKAETAAVKFLEIVNREDFQLVIAEVIQTLLENKDGSEEDVWKLLGEFGVPGLASWFVSLERSPEKFLQEFVLQS